MIRGGYCIRFLAVAAAAAMVLAAAACGSRTNSQQSAAPGFEDAVQLVRSGETEQAVTILRNVVKSHSGREGDRAALFLGNILVRQKRPSEALPLLERAAAGTVGPEYGKILLVTAVLESGASSRYDEAAGVALKLAKPGVEGVSSLLRQHAVYLLARVRSEQQLWSQAQDAASQYLQEWPSGDDVDELRWLLAQAESQQGKLRDAYETYQAIWYETLASPWAKQAHDELKKLRSQRGFPARKLNAADLYEFAKTLRGVGMHEEALDEIDEFLRRFPGNRKTDGALFMRAMSDYSLRRNPQCVQTVEELRRRFPHSRWAPAASIYAVKALRRSDNTAQIRRWCNRIYREYPHSPKAYEALYNLGVYLGNVVSEQKGIEVLAKLVQEAPKHYDADDAMWKMAWMQRRRGDTTGAVHTLDTLLREQPESGYRRAALYWLARFIEPQERQRAIELYQTLLREFPNDYYGHRAQEHLVALGSRLQQIGNGRNLTGIDLLDDPGHYTGPGAEHYVLACHLKELGLFEFAADELRAIPGSSESQSLQFALAEMYSRSGNTWEAATILGRYFKDFMVAGSRDPDLVPMEFWRICYPFNYREIVRSAISKAHLGVDEYLVAALIRMESRFFPTAVSPVGAIGLMQIMPKTAEKIAAERGLAPPTRRELFRPVTNIQYGTYFLSKRIDDFSGDWFPAICSYNAGVGPVKKWWAARPPGEDLDEFIENIPYVATRLYIKQILGDYKNYEWIYPQR